MIRRQSCSRRDSAPRPPARAIWRRNSCGRRCGAPRNISWRARPGRCSMNNADVRSRSIDAVLGDLRRRRRMLRAVDHAARGLLYGAILATVLAAIGAIAQATWLQQTPWRVLWCVPVVAGLVGLVGLLRR